MRDENQSLNGTSGATPRMGAVTLVRHGEPDLSRRMLLDWRGYRDWWAKYEEAGLLEGQTPPHILEAYAREARHIYSSTIRRSIETAQAVCGDKPFEQLPMLVEAPLPPPHLPSWIRLSPKSWGWGTVSRLWWWYFDDHDADETRKQAVARAVEAASFLVGKAREGGDVLVLAHGYFNLMISLELKKMGFIKTVEQGFKYWGCRRYELRIRR